MKLALVLFIGLINTTYAQNTYKNVDATTFKQLIEKENGLLLDVRTPGEYSRGHIAGSTLIDVSDPQAVSKIQVLQKNKPVYIYCLTGSRSQMVANFMVQNGFPEVYNLQRGVVEWNQMGFPIKQSQRVVAATSPVYQEKDIEELLRVNNVVLINFHAPWCAPCKKMAPAIAKLSNEYAGRAKITKVDVDVNKKLQQVYGVQSIPGLVLYKNGKEVWRYSGVLSYDDLLKVMSQFV